MMVTLELGMRIIDKYSNAVWEVVDLAGGGNSYPIKARTVVEGDLWEVGSLTKWPTSIDDEVWRIEDSFTTWVRKTREEHERLYGE